MWFDRKRGEKKEKGVVQFGRRLRGPTDSDIRALVAVPDCHQSLYLRSDVQAWRCWAERWSRAAATAAAAATGASA